MTMHNAKGLNARVVFIPGLENKILPGEKREAYQGLIHEAARLLYVSITRASAACIMTFCKSRVVGKNREFRREGSRFIADLTGRFIDFEGSMTNEDVQAILSTIAELENAGSIITSDEVGYTEYNDAE